jgi:glycosyltransferase involved in cell wall biosynthesis
MNRRPRIAVVSPFLDKRHGTERVVAEQIERLSGQYGWDIHIFSQRVEDLPGVERAGKSPPSATGVKLTAKASPERPGGALIWHRVPSLPGPHLFQYLWWFYANRICRWWVRRANGLHFDLIYSPGINCRDANAIAVHIVFHEFYRLVGGELKLNKLPVRTWPRALHRRLYYALVMALERRIYSNPRIQLTAVSNLAARQLAKFFGREDITVIFNAIDAESFNPRVRQARRAGARAELHLDKNDFVLLLIGNDWKKKGLPCLLESLARLDAAILRLLVVGTDARSSYDEILRSRRLQSKVFFLPPRADVQFYYAAADAYVGPSVEDAFALPPAEAMACGLPVIVSRQAGVSEWVRPGADGLILEDPKDADELAKLIHSLVSDPSLCKRLGENAATTARQYTWERNAAEIKSFLEEAIRRDAQASVLSKTKEAHDT